MIQPAFFDGDVNIRALSGPVGLDQRQAELPARHVFDLHLVIGGVSLEIAGGLVEILDALLVFFELGGIVGLGENSFEQNRMRDSDGAQIVHGPAHHAIAKNLIAFEGDLPDLHLGAFINVEIDDQRGRRHLAHFRLDAGELAAALGQVFEQHVAGALDLIRIVLSLGAQSDFAFLEAVQDFRDRDRLHARVVDGTDDASLDHHEAHDPAGAAGFLLQRNVVEAVAVPQDQEIAAELFVVDAVALFGDDQGAQRVGGDAAITAEFDGFDGISRRLLHGWRVDGGLGGFELGPGNWLGLVRFGLFRFRRFGSFGDCLKRIGFLLLRRVLLLLRGRRRLSGRGLLLRGRRSLACWRLR